MAANALDLDSVVEDLPSRVCFNRSVAVLSRGVATASCCDWGASLSASSSKSGRGGLVDKRRLNHESISRNEARMSNERHERARELRPTGLLVRVCGVYFLGRHRENSPRLGDCISTIFYQI